MTKCSQCRKNDTELLSWWERVKNWLFNHLFPQDIIDLSQDKYTQGFSDGYVKGREVERGGVKKVEDLQKKVASKLPEILELEIQTIIGDEEL